MAFLDTIDEEAAEGRVSEQYQSERSSMGYLPNYVQAFSLRPEVFDAWAVLIGTIRANMDLRRYELVTLPPARALRSSYCSLAHGKIPLDRFGGEEALRDLFVGASPQDGVDRAVMELAAKVAHDSTSVTASDIDGLRRVGLSDEEILDVVLAASARALFTKVIDGTGTRPDSEYRIMLGAEMVEILSVGRPIEDPV